VVLAVNDWVSNPEAALRWASEALVSAASAETKATAWHAAAVAYLERGELDQASRAVRKAIAAAEPDAVHELHLLLAWIEQDKGNPDASMRHLDLAGPHLKAAALARARCLRGLNLCVAGEYEPALRELTSAVNGSRRHDDRHWLANALNARGVVKTYLRRWAAADRDLAEARELFVELGERERAAACVHNRGFVALQANELPAAVRLFEQAVADGLRVSGRPETMVDRAYAMIGAGLIAEAGDILIRAEELLDDAGRSMRLAEATLALGECAARAGRRELALATAWRAKELFRRQRRAGWLAAADSLRLRLAMTPDALPAAREVAKRCVRHGFLVEAAELRLAAARVAEPAAARRLLRPVEVNRTSGPNRLRALGWLARAKLAELDGDRRAVFSACRAGSRTGAGELAEVAIETAFDAGDPIAVLRWMGQVPVRTLIETLGQRAMLAYFWHGGLAALSIVDGRVRLHRLGGTAERIRADIDALRFTLGARVRTGRAHGLVTGAAARLDRQLLAPFRSLPRDRSLVVVPADGMGELPWAALRTCAGRPVSVAPSITAWLRAARIPSAGLTRRVWVAGPGLEHAEREVAHLHEKWGGRLLTGVDSTVDNVLSAMDSAGLVHLAAHGTYRADAPMFSSVELTGGALHGYDLDRLARAPRLLVLSACEGALAAPVLLRRGTVALIASTLPVADDAAVELVATLHAQLHAGASPAQALASAQQTHGDRGFVCIGAG
jgi:tetratricopeptide (TPR) repeat protein